MQTWKNLFKGILFLQMVLPLNLTALSWLAPVTVAQLDNMTVSYPNILLKTDFKGDSIAIWNEIVDDFSNLQNFRYAKLSVNNQWTSPKYVLSDTQNNLVLKSFDLNDSACGTFLWYDENNKKNYSIDIISGNAWSNMQLLDDVDAADQAKLVVNSKKEAFAIWLSDSQRIYISYKPLKGPWKSQLISPDEPGMANPQIALSKNNHVVVVWENKNTQQIHAAFYHPKTELWAAASNPVSRVVSGRDRACNPSVCILPDGEAYIAWESQIDQKIHVCSATSDKLSKQAALSSGDDKYPQIKANKYGHVILIWQNFAEKGKSKVVGSRAKQHQQKWAKPTVFNSNEIDAAYPDFALDGSGNAVVAWVDHMAHHSIIQSVIYLNDGSLHSPANLSNEIVAAIHPRVEVHESGKTLIIWSSYDIRGEIAIESTWTHLATPEIKGRKKVSHFMSKSVWVNILEWTTLPNSTIDYFNLYRNGELLAKLPSTQKAYSDQFRDKRKQDTYSISAVSVTGIESPLGSITL